MDKENDNRPLREKIAEAWNSPQPELTNKDRWDKLGIWVMGGVCFVVITLLFVLVLGFAKWLWNL